MKTFPLFKMLFLYFAFATSAIAQQPYFSYRTLTKGDHISFPVFAPKGNAKAAADINALLQVKELQVLDSYFQKDIFESISRWEDEEFHYAYDINFEVKENTPRMLSVRFNLSSCGATCYYWSSCYNFNPQTGEPVQLGDLFTAEGLESFAKKASGRWKAHMDAGLKNEDAETIESLQELGDCFENTFTLVESFYLKGNDLFIDAENCLPKYAKFYDIDTAVRFSIKELIPYLNDYGRSVLGLTSKLPSGYKGELLKELIVAKNNDKDIVLALVIEGHTAVTGYYADPKNGTYTPLEGTYTNGKLSCQATDDGGKVTAHINATITGNDITVIYDDEAGNKKPTVVLVRQ